MDVWRPSSRRSTKDDIDIVGPEQPPCRSASGKAKRYSWTFRSSSTRSTRDASPRRYRGQDSLLLPPVDLISRSASPIRSLSAPTTRDSSPERHDRLPERPRSSHGFKLRVPNFSRTLPPRGSTLPTIMEGMGSFSDSLRSRISATKVKQWDGRTRTTVPWDGLRRDPELWFEKGNCLVHLYTKGQSRRGPSFRVPMEEIQAAGFEALFSMFYNEVAMRTGRESSGDGTMKLSKSAICEIYIPAPDYSSKDDAFAWHITTRNFFAFLFGKALVGENLSKSMVDLQDRLHLLRANDSNNQADMMAYLERMRYLEFAHCPDYSLALLSFAEHYELQDLWIDAFVHCAGMNEMLNFSPEFEKTSRITKALITRAYLEMDLHLGRVTRSLSNFLEEDFSPAYLGLSSGARAHLERFRSFLYTYYVEKFGYWPPPRGTVFSKSLCKSMYFDFRSLYDYLVDLDSTVQLAEQKPASGGICVLQNLQAFDSRHKYIPLPHPHPLLPEYGNEPRRSGSQRALLSIKLSMRQSRTDRSVSARDALAAATNSSDFGVANAPLVKAYKRFERQCSLRPEEKVSMNDGRKVRWMLIYGIVQMLVSVIRAPKEVRDVDSPTYPLCCLITETFPWKGGARALNDTYTESINLSSSVSATSLLSLDSSMWTKPLPTTPLASIQPDCEVEDYFQHTNNPSPTATPQRYSSTTLEGSAQRRRSLIFRNPSFRAVNRMSMPSFAGGRRNSQVVKSPSPNFCEILVHGYGNGLNETVLDEKNTPSELSSEILPEIVVSAQSPPRAESPPPQESLMRENIKRRTAPARLITPAIFELPLEPSRTPILDSFDVHKILDTPLPALEDVDSPSDNSNSAPITPIWSRSTSPSSANGQEEPTKVDRRASVAGNSTFSTDSTVMSSPTLGPLQRSASGITIKRTFSVDSSVAKDMGGLKEMISPELLPEIMNDIPVEVYTPSGAPLKKREGSQNLRNKAVNTTSPKGNLKRSDAVSWKSKRRSVRIRDEVDLFEALKMRPRAIV